MDLLRDALMEHPESEVLIQGLLANFRNHKVFDETRRELAYIMGVQLL